MKITLKWLKEKGACSECVEWFKGQKETDGVWLVKALMGKNAQKNDWANWLIVRIMTRPQYLAYAIYAAEQVIGIYENEHPNDDRPRKAIEAAKAVLKEDTPGNRAAAWDARAAAGAAARAAWAAAWAAAGAAGAAARVAAWDASWSAGDAAWAAAWAARGARAAARIKLQKKILLYGLAILGKNEKEAK